MLFLDPKACRAIGDVRGGAGGDPSPGWSG
jgi:hypothetical protein